MRSRLLVLSVVVVMAASAFAVAFAAANDANDKSQPEEVERFLEICKVPRSCYHDEKIGRYLMDFAEDNGFPHEMDDAGNIYIDHPGSRDSGTILQAHMDMVAAADVEHDFENDPIDAYIDDGWIRARGTTLGADDGFGLAILLCALKAPELDGIAFRCLFTVDEDVGLLGAMELDPSWLSGYGCLVNVDDDRENEIVIGSAGAGTYRLSFVPSAESNADPCYVLDVRGLLGGHSGDCIGFGRANAIRLALGFTDMIEGARLYAADGGAASNAIPQSARLYFSAPAGVDVQSILAGYLAGVVAQYGENDPDISMTVSVTDRADSVWSSESTAKFTDMILSIPNSVIRESDAGVITSSNLGIISTGNGKVSMEIMFRSADDAEKDSYYEVFRGIFARDSVSLDSYISSTGWSQDPDCDLVRKASDIMGRHFGEETSVIVIHAGLECGVFEGLCPSLDQISIGANILGAHTTDECLEISSLSATKECVFDIVRALAQ